MVEIDYVVREIKLSYSGIVNLNEIYNLIRSWFNERGFFVMEKESEGAEEESGNSFYTKFHTFRKVEESTKYVIEVKIRGKSLKDRSENKPRIKFLRGLYEKFIEKSRFNRYESELRDLTHEFYNEVKAFLNLAKT